MSPTKSDPWELATLDQLLTIAGAMEREAIDGYASLSLRMGAMGRPDLAGVFDSLVAEETSHLAKVDEWRQASKAPETGFAANAPADLFDDEGAATVAPQLLSAYRAFSAAVRNEERAFAFWTYVSAHAKSDDVRQAAERMAREELGHVATLRRERRKAFHAERTASSNDKTDMLTLEATLCRQLESMTASAGGDKVLAPDHLRQARARLQSIGSQPFDLGPPYRIIRQETVDALPLCEYLLDWYLDIAGRVKDEHDAGRARSFAAQLLACLRALRDSKQQGLPSPETDTGR